MIQEVYHLLDPKIAENSPAIQRLKEQFASMLPPQFSSPSFFPSPSSNLSGVFRANCSNKDCSVRAMVHIGRDESGVLVIEEKEVIYDRFSNPCSDCGRFKNNQ